MDKIVQGNTANIVFLKSTDDSMIDTLQKMSGTTHVVRRDSKTVTHDLKKILIKNEGKISYNIHTQEEPVIKYNDLAFLPQRNSIVFRAGDSPIWNRNETIMPMSWRLFMNTIKSPGKDFNLQTIPSLSTAIDFDVRKNQPNFSTMFDKKVLQAIYTEEANEIYSKAYNYSEYDIERLDPDVYSDERMEIINKLIMKEALSDNPDIFYVDDEDSDGLEILAGISQFAEDNEEQIRANHEVSEKRKALDKKIYAGGSLSKSDIYDNGFVNKINENFIINAYKKTRAKFANDEEHFTFIDGDLYDESGEILYIKQIDSSDSKEALIQAGKDPDKKVYMDNVDSKELEDVGTYYVTKDFYKFLVSLDTWEDIAHGDFEYMMKNQVKFGENEEK